MKQIKRLGEQATEFASQGKETMKEKEKEFLANIREQISHNDTKEGFERLLDQAKVGEDAKNQVSGLIYTENCSINLILNYVCFCAIDHVQVR